VVKRKYNLNEEFFNNDTPESFYWAGFIMADGCVATNKYKNPSFISINISEKDLEVLEKFKASIGFDGPIKHTRTRTTFGVGDFVKIQVCSTKMAKSIGRFGVVPSKTHICEFSKWIMSHEYVNHFMRGYVDGDGSFFTTHMSDIDHLHFSVCGTKRFLESFRGILVDNCKLRTNKVSKSRGIYEFRYSGNRNCVKIRDFLYRDATPDMYLVRKYNKSHDDFTIRPKNQYKFKAIVGRNINTGEEIFFNSIKDVKTIDLNPKNIWYRLSKSKEKLSGGFLWRYATGEEIKKEMGIYKW